MAITRKPVTRKPTWLSGTILPVVAGVAFGAFGVPQFTSTLSLLMWWYIFAGWLFMCGLAVIFERAPVYGATSMPQSQRLCELYGFQWIGMGVLTIVAAQELTTATMDDGQQLSLPSIVLITNLICTFGFSIAAGPTRLVNANDNEMKLVPLNSFLVAVMTTTLFI